MGKIVITLLAFVCFANTLFGQKITMVKTFGGVRFEMDTLTLSPRQVLNIMDDNPQAYEEFKRAKTNYNVSGVCGFAGGFLIAMPLVTAVVGGEPEWGLAAAGGAFILASIPFNRAFHRHAQNALDDYNKKFSRSKADTHLYVTGLGARLVIKF